MSSSLPSFGTTNVATAVPSNTSVVIPPITIPSNLTLAQPGNSYNFQGPQLNKITGGLDGAKQFQTVANAMYALFEDDDDVFYIKVTDKNNYPVSLKRYRFFEEEEPAPPVADELATKSDVDSLMKEIESLKEELRSMKEGNYNGKQYIRPKNNNYRTNGNQSANVPTAATLPATAPIESAEPTE